ncbi:uncharacterized protein [Henckelia pumila]|uniref:uncharacterized protein isoform X3 n=1 Tax=Henckelia pumila TaxID=405737 RepID=UPI003C6E3E76
MLRGSPGLYSYAIFEYSKEHPGFNLNTTRIAFMLRKDKFHYMAVGDSRQRYMPLADNRLPGQGQALAYPEAVRLVDPVEPEFKGELVSAVFGNVPASRHPRRSNSEGKEPEHLGIW